MMENLTDYINKHFEKIKFLLWNKMSYNLKFEMVLSSLNEGDFIFTDGQEES